MTTATGVLGAPIRPGQTCYMRETRVAKDGSLSRRFHYLPDRHGAAPVVVETSTPPAPPERRVSRGVAQETLL